MKSILALSAACVLALSTLGTASVARAQTPDPAVLAPVNGLIDAFNHNDAASIAGLHAPGAVILDEFAPYAWSGPTAVMAWGADFGKFAVAHGVTSGVVSLSAPSTVEVNGDRAYVVAPSVIAFTTKDKPIKNAGSFTFALIKTDKGWLIQSWAYARGAALP